MPIGFDVVAEQAARDLAGVAVGLRLAELGRVVVGVEDLRQDGRRALVAGQLEPVPVADLGVGVEQPVVDVLQGEHLVRPS